MRKNYDLKIGTLEEKYREANVTRTQDNIESGADKSFEFKVY
jgi:hypothetical protein